MTVAPEVDPGAAFFEAYRLVKLIGKGSMGSVYEAARVSDARPVAVKFLTQTHDREQQARFGRELDVLRRIDHPNVVRVLDGALHHGSPWMVLELVGGGTLADLLRRDGKLAPEAAVAIASDVLAGLEACHGAQVLHRDLKPANVLLTTDGRAKLGDLGIARDERADVNLTAQGLMLGTPLYMAPEVLIDGEPWTVAAEIYGVGALLFEMLAGERPVVGDNVSDIIAQHALKTKSLSARAPHVPRPLADVVDRAVARTAAERPASAGELLHELHRALPGRSLTLNLAAPATPAGDLPETYIGPRSGKALVPAPPPKKIDVSRRVEGRSVIPYQPVALAESGWVAVPAAVFAPAAIAIALASGDPLLGALMVGSLALVGSAIKDTLRRVLRRQAAIVIDEDGFEDRRLGLGRIPWSEVRDIKLIPGAKSHHLIKVSLTDPERLGNLTMYGMLSSRLEKEPRKARLFLGVGALQVTASQLYQLLDERWKAART